MPQSMTGYGRCTLAQDGREVTIELKSVNHRFLDLAFRMPRSLPLFVDITPSRPKPPSCVWISHE